MTQKKIIPHAELIALKESEFLIPFPAYAEDRFYFDSTGALTKGKQSIFSVQNNCEPLNHFCLAYLKNAPLILHAKLAEIVQRASGLLHQQHGWVMYVFDGLRPMEAGILLQNSRPDLVESGLLARAGNSAHNRAMAVDLAPFNANRIAIPMGGFFDSEDMTRNHRNYRGNLMTIAEYDNRIIFESAMQRAAYQCETLIAPLQSEFWDFRFPGSHHDLWRILESIARCIGQQQNAVTQEYKTAIESSDSIARAHELFCGYWDRDFIPHAEQLAGLLGGHTPPSMNSWVFHESYENVWDRDLPPHLKIVRQESV